MNVSAPRILITALLFFAPFAVVHTLAQQSRLYPDHLLELRALTTTAMSPDGNEILYVQYKPVPDGYYDVTIWKSTRLDEEPVFLTRGAYPRWSPDGKTIAFISNRDGSYQIWSMLPDGSQVKKLTSVQWGVHDLRWSPDGKTIAFLATAPGAGEKPAANRNFTFFRHLFLLDLTTGTTQRMTRKDFTITDFSWAPDSRRLVFAARPNQDEHTNSDTDLYLISRTSKKIKTLVQRPGADYRPVWSPDGRFIAFVSGHGRVEAYANRSLALISPHGGKIKTFPGFPDAGGVFEGPWNLVWDFDSKKIYFTMTRGTSVLLHSLDISTGVVRQLGKHGAVLAGLSLNRNTSQMAFLLSTPSSPWDVFRTGTTTFSPVRVTRVNTVLDTITSGMMHQVRWKNSRGDTIEGLLALPPDFSSDRAWPMVTYLHGGPGYNVVSSFRSVSPSAFWAIDRYLPWLYAARGYVVFMPNFHSSGGYGEAFKKNARGKLASLPMDDVLTGVDVLIQNGVAHPKKLALAGFGAGGYLAAYILAHTHRFQAAIIDTAPVDPQSWWASAPLQISSFMGGHPWQARKKYRRNSPIEIAHKIRTPVLFIHNETDPYIPFSSVRQLHRTLQIRDIPTRMLAFRESGFSIIKPEHILQAIQENLRWLQIYVMSGTGKKAR